MCSSGEYLVVEHAGDSLLLRRPLPGLYRAAPGGYPLSRSRELSIRLLRGNPGQKDRSRAGFALLSHGKRWKHGGKLLRLPLGTNLSEAEELAQKTARSHPVTLLCSHVSVGYTPLFREIAKFEVVDSLEFLSEAMEAARELSRTEELQKAINPLSSSGFAELVDSIAKRLSGATAEEERRALRRALEESTDADWPSLTEAGLVGALATLVAPIQDLSRRAILQATSVLEDEAEKLVSGVRGALRERHPAWGLATSLNVTDRRVAEHVVDTQANFIRDEYGRRALAASEAARRLVSRRVAQGLGREHIARELQATVFGAGVNRSLAYWRVIASAFANRARTFAQLSSFREAGVKLYEAVATLDSATTDFCRWVDGKHLRVDEGLRIFDEVRKLSDPEAVKYANPWVTSGVDDDDNPAMFARVSPDRRVRLANVVRSGVGNNDDRGEYANELSTDELGALNIGPPPYHGLCRTTIVAVL